MNDFQSTESGKGILKDVYEGKSPIEAALREKRKKRSENILSQTKEEAEGSESRD